MFFPTGKKTFNEMSVLAPLLTIYTLTYLALMGYDFAAKDSFNVPAGLMAVYITLVLAYAADKEIRRWTGKETPPRKGTLFVYLWMLFYLVAFVIYSLKPEYTLPNDLTKVVFQVLGIFFGSKVSKKIFQSRKGAVTEEVVPQEEAPRDSVPTDERTTEASEAPVKDESASGGRNPEEIILDVIRKNGQAKRENLLSATGLSRSSLGRLLDEMEAKGLITQVGDRKASHYTLGGPARQGGSGGSKE